MAKVSLSPPWDIFVSEVEQLFLYDAQVHAVYDESTYTLKLYVDEPKKADALMQLLPSTKQYGNVTLNIMVVPADDVKIKTREEKNLPALFAAAFNGNAALSFIKTVHGIFLDGVTYVVFENHVVQFFNDDISDVYGQCSTLYQNIAKDVFGELENIYFCTDLPNANGFCMEDAVKQWP